jgi:hypothetical protein
LATFESRSGLKAFAGVGEAKDPEEARLTDPGLRGVDWSACSESIRTWGV